MNAYEYLAEKACKDGIDIIDRNFDSKRIKGLYCDGTVALNANIETSTERACVLAEELGHHHTSSGIIIDLSNAENRKQERQARFWAYNDRIGLRGLIRAYEHGCKNRHETAEFLEVTEEFLEDAVNTYREKYGVFITIDNYVVYFIPQLIICKKF